MPVDRRYVLVVSPAYVKPLRDGSKVAIIFPGASPGAAEKLNEAVEELLKKPVEDMEVLIIKTKEMDAVWVPVKKVEEVRGGEG